jgi:hypothetical protein
MRPLPWLHPKRTASDAGRPKVAVCLRAFGEHATFDRRKALSTGAHERRLAWNFGAAEPVIICFG